MEKLGTIVIDDDGLVYTTDTKIEQSKKYMIVDTSKKPFHIGMHAIIYFNDETNEIKY